MDNPMEQARRERSEDLGPFFEICPDPLSVMDLQGRFIVVNPAFENAMGFSCEEVEGRSFLEFVSPDDQSLTEAQFKRLAREQTNETMDNWCRCSDGSYKSLRWRCTYDASRGRIFAAASDLTESVQLLNSLIAASPQPIIAVDNDRMVRVWNPAAVRTFGWTAEEVLGRRVPFVRDQNQRESSDIFNERALSGEQFTNLQLRRTRRDGTPVDLLVSTAITHDKNGKVDGFCFRRDGHHGAQEARTTVVQSAAIGKSRNAGERHRA
jgi:PAS domain S-box-containing protein